MTIDYSDKPQGYFSGARKRFVDDLSANPRARLLEIGCGNGDTAAYAKMTRKCGWCAGVEVCPQPAAAAAGQMDLVLVGDIEGLELPFPRHYFDVLIISEVLEHLRDPWGVLRKLRPYLTRDAVILAGSPNVAHRSVIRMLMRGDWTYSNSGVMDCTHLRWFTPRSYRRLFESCGYCVEYVGPAMPLRTKAGWVDRLTFGRFRHLLHTQVYLRARPQ